MKKILGIGPNETRSAVAILLLRIGLGALMLVHGIPKLIMLLSGDPVQFLPVMGMSAEVALALTVFAEVFCSIFIILGLGTRYASVPLIITMIVAVFVVHAADPFAKQELGLQYLLGYIVLMISGSGKYSIDYLFLRRLFSNYHPGVKPEDPTLSIYQ